MVSNFPIDSVYAYFYIWKEFATLTRLQSFLLGLSTSRESSWRPLVESSSDQELRSSFLPWDRAPTSAVVIQVVFP